MKKNTLSILICSFFLFATGCATIGRDHQVVRVDSYPEGANVYYKNDFVGQTPVLLPIERERQASLRVESAQNKQDIQWQGQFRWWRSGLGNWIFGPVGLIGTAIDLYSGDAYSFEQNVQLQFAPATRMPERQTSRRSKRLAIAPPFSHHPNITDELAAIIERRFIEKNEYEVLPYKSTFEDFKYEDVDYDRKLDDDHQLELFGVIEADNIYFSELEPENNNKEIRVVGEVKNLLHPEKNKKVNFAVPTSELKSYQDLAWAHKEELFFWLPNTISLDFADASTSLDVNERIDIEADATATDDTVGKFSRYISAIGVRRMNPPSRRKKWSYHFSFIPTASVAYNKEVFPDFKLLNEPALADLNDLEFTRLHVDAGYGASFNWSNQNVNLYFNMFPVLAYDRIQTNVNSESIDKSATKVRFVAELGATYFLTSHWHLRLFSRSANVPEELWQEALSEASQTHAKVYGSYVVSSGISVGYILPNKIFQRSKGR